MKKFSISLGIGVLLLLVVAAPALAAKGSTKIASVKGTISGDQYVVTTCGWGPDMGGPTPYWSYSISVGLGSDQSPAVVNASSLGKGTMTWSALATPFGDMGSSPTLFTFTGSNGTSTILGPVNLGMGGDQFGPTVNYYFNVVSGTGKFAGVTGGSLQTVQTSFNAPTCDPGSSPPLDWNPATGPVQTGIASGSVPFNYIVYGQLLY